MSLVCTAALTVLWDDDALCHDGDLCLWSTPSPLPSMILTLGDWVANPLSHSPVCGDVRLAVNGGGGCMIALFPTTPKNLSVCQLNMRLAEFNPSLYHPNVECVQMGCWGLIQITIMSSMRHVFG